MLISDIYHQLTKTDQYDVSLNKKMKNKIIKNNLNTLLTRFSSDNKYALLLLVLISIS
jgi:hypothetical protein